MARRGSFLPFRRALGQRTARFITLVGVAALFAATFAFYRAERQAKFVPLQNPAAPAARAPLDARLAGARTALSQRQYLLALSRCDQAQRLGAPVPAVEEVRAAIFRKTDYLDREIDSYQRWAAADPSSANPWLSLFYVFSDLSWKREADDASTQALRRAPENLRAHVARALFLNSYVGPQQALAEIGAALRAAPNDPALLNLRAITLLKQDRAREAEADLRAALIREPNKVSHLLPLAEALSRQGRDSEAADCLRRVQKQDPKDVASAYQLGLMADRRGNTAEALAQFERAAAINVQHDKLAWQLSRIYRQQGRLKESAALARMYGAMQRNTDALESLTSRLDARPGDLKLHWQLAMRYLAFEDYPRAIVELRAVDHFQPDDKDVRRALVIALTKAGRRTEAQAVRGAASAPRASR